MYRLKKVLFRFLKKKAHLVHNFLDLLAVTLEEDFHLVMVVHASGPVRQIHGVQVVV
jgi:hypothetical protein